MRDVKTVLLALLVVIMILVVGRLSYAGNYIEYPYAEYQGHVITDLGTFAIYKAKWSIVQREYDSRKGLDITVLAFSDRKRGEIWYSEGVLDKMFGKLKVWETPLERELKNVYSIENWNREVERDRSDESRGKEKPLFETYYNVKGIVIR